MLNKQLRAGEKQNKSKRFQNENIYIIYEITIKRKKLYKIQIQLPNIKKHPNKHEEREEEEEA